MPIKTVKEFAVQRLEVLDEAGQADEALVPDLPPKELLQMYRSMKLARAADERLLKLQRQGRVGTFAPCAGQEAAVVGPVYAMRQQDWFVGSFRELGGLLARGVPLWRYYLYYKGFEEGNVFSEAARTLPISVPVASQLLHAVGLAYAMRYQGEEETAVVAFVGDGGTSQGDFHEALNFAAVWRVGVVFVIQNNGWAISVPVSEQTHSETLAQKAIAYDMPGMQVDGNDVLAMYRATREGLARARAGNGPTLIEAETYRTGVHTTSDDPTKYRDDAEVAPWRAREPLLRFQKYLRRRDVLDDEIENTLAGEITSEIEAAVQEFERKTGPTADTFAPDVPFDHVFAEPAPYLEAQRRELLAQSADPALRAAEE
jgi:pyruvate dehydrogenase E1 component alpha subunit